MPDRLSSGMLIAVSVFGVGARFAWAAQAPGDDTRLGLRQDTAKPYLPVLEFRGFVGLQPGAEVDVRLGDHWRVEGAQRLPSPGLPAVPYLTDVALHRQLGSSTSKLWVRAGYEYQHTQQSCSDRTGGFNDNAQALDLGIVLRHRSPRGHLFQADLGLETLWRAEALGCNDSGVGKRSTGARIGLLGQVALFPHVGLFGRVGVRTAEHLLEIDALPQAEVGLAFEF
jgi:hypothetical protein